MSADDARWSLPGPARAIEALCDRLYRERAITVRAPVAAVGLRRAVERRLNADGQVQVLPVTVRPGLPVLAEIAAAAQVGASGAAALVTAPSLTDHALIIEGATAADGDLDDLVRLAARGGNVSTPLVMVIGSGDVPGFGGTDAHEPRAVATPLDAAAHLAALPLAWTGPEQRLAIAVATEVAGWDIGLLGRLVTLRIAEVVRPDLHLPAWQDERLTQWAGRPASWAAGSLDDWSGEAWPHPLWLAANRPDQLAKRVWRGQVSAMLPFIEMRRLELIARFRTVLRADRDRCGPDVEMLDWGPLRFQLARQARWLVELADAFRHARNELAHGRPLAWAEISECLVAARRWSSRATTLSPVR